MLQGYTVGGERVYRAELKQGRVPCACLYTEEEYKALVIEAHYTCRYHFWEDPGSEKRYHYWCKYCHMDFSDKNALSYHRYKDQCKKWKEVGTGILKMYPTFSQSEQHLLKDIFLEVGLSFPEKEGRRPWNPREQAAHVAHTDPLVQPKSRKSRTTKTTSKETSHGVGIDEDKVKEKRLKQAPAPCTSSELQRTTEGIEGSVQDVIHRICATVVQEKGSDNPVVRKPSEKKEPAIRDASSKRVREWCGTTTGRNKQDRENGSKKKTTSLAEATKNKKDKVGDDEVLSRVTEDRDCSHQISEDFGNVEGFFTLIHVNAGKGKGNSTAGIVQVDANASVYSFTPDSTREEVLGEARRYAMSLTVENTYPNIGHPPPEQGIAGLYHLIQESPQCVIIDRQLLHNAEQCMAELRSLEKRDELGARILAAIGPWVAWKEAQVFSDRSFLVLHVLLLWLCRRERVVRADPS